jgi:predicted small lipoprotein YifL
VKAALGILALWLLLCSAGCGMYGSLYLEDEPPPAEDAGPPTVDDEEEEDAAGGS